MKKEIGKKLLEIKAVFFRPDDPFTWASGIKSPVYCDNRLILTAPQVRDFVEEAIAETVKEKFPTCQVLMGTATAGIAHAALAAHALNLPMGYVRSSAKDHGRGNMIEGRLNPGQKVVVIEDLISTGGSVVETVKALRDSGGDVLGIVSIFTYGLERGKKALEEANVTNYSLTDFDAIIGEALQEGYIKEEDVAKLMDFRDSL